MLMKLWRLYVRYCRWVQDLVFGKKDGPESIPDGPIDDWCAEVITHDDPYAQDAYNNTKIRKSTNETL